MVETLELCAFNVSWKLGVGSISGIRHAHLGTSDFEPSLKRTMWSARPGPGQLCARARAACERPRAQAIIYCNTRRKVDFLADQLTKRDFTISTMHADPAPPSRFPLAPNSSEGQPEGGEAW